MFHKNKKQTANTVNIILVHILIKIYKHWNFFFQDYEIIVFKYMYTRQNILRMVYWHPY